MHITRFTSWLEQLCCKKWQKSPCQETGFGNRGRLKVRNNIILVLNEHKWPPELFRINLDHSEVPYSPNQYLDRDFFATSYSKAHLGCGSEFLNPDISVKPWFLRIPKFRILGISKKILNNLNFLYIILEIKPCGLGSRIRDMEAERNNWSHLLIGEHLDYFLFCKQNWHCEMNRTLS